MKTLEDLLQLVSIRMRPDIEFTLINSQGERIRCFKSNFNDNDIVAHYHTKDGRLKSTSSRWDDFPDYWLFTDLGVESSSTDWRFAEETFDALNDVIKECNLIIKELTLYNDKQTR